MTFSPAGYNVRVHSANVFATAAKHKPFLYLSMRIKPLSASCPSFVRCVAFATAQDRRGRQAGALPPLPPQLPRQLPRQQSLIHRGQPAMPPFLPASDSPRAVARLTQLPRQHRTRQLIPPRWRHVSCWSSRTQRVCPARWTSMVCMSGAVHPLRSLQRMQLLNLEDKTSDDVKYLRISPAEDLM